MDDSFNDFNFDPVELEKIEYICPGVFGCGKLFLSKDSYHPDFVKELYALTGRPVKGTCLKCDPQDQDD